MGLAYFFFFQDEEAELRTLYTAVVIGFFAALLGDHNRPRCAWVGWFANSVAFWSVLLLAVRAGGLNWVLSSIVALVVGAALAAIAFIDFLHNHQDD